MVLDEGLIRVTQRESTTNSCCKSTEKNMKMQLIAAALASATAALSSPAFARDASASANATAQLHRTSAFQRAYHQSHADPEIFNAGWTSIDRSRPGTVDPDLRPSAN